MQNSYVLGEDAEPPSTDARSSDSKGYRSSNNPNVHESLHGRNLFSQTNPFKKSRIVRNYSLPSCFLPTVLISAELNGRFAERSGMLDEDDEYPPSVSYKIESRSPGYLKYFWITNRDRLYRFSRMKRIHSICGIRRNLLPVNEPKNIRALSLRAELSPCASFLRSVSYVSWFRSVPTCRLAPPGRNLC